MSNIARLEEVSPGAAEAFRLLRTAADGHGSLEPKYREFCMLSGFAVTGNESAFRGHCARAKKAGATQAEVEQVVILQLGTSMGLVPVVKALGWAREVFSDTSS